MGKKCEQEYPTVDSLLKEGNVDQVDSWLLDGEGEIHGFSVPCEEFKKNDKGEFGWDGSSLRGFEKTEQSDLDKDL